MKDILAQLKGGDRRSIGNAGKAVKEAAADPTRFRSLFRGMSDRDPVVRMRAADAVEKITRRRSDLLQPFKQFLLRAAATAQDKQMRWHIAQMLPRLRLAAGDRSKAVRHLMDYLDDESSIVKTSSMQALVDFSRQDHKLVPKVTPLIERLTKSGTPAMKSRGRKLLTVLQSAAKSN